MNDVKSTPATSTYREWFGSRRYLESAYRKYDFPVSTRKVVVSRDSGGVGNHRG